LLRRTPALLGPILLLLLLARPPASDAFSVLAHQGVIDRTWDDTIVPALRQRHPAATPQDLERARAFAYGGSHIADLGYFPFGSRLFTDLVHYVRTGDFVAALIAESTTLDEHAFALGAASHWVTDSIGHSEATNRVVPVLDPELRQEHGDEITYAEDASAHMSTEFRFDVLQLSRSRQSPDLFQHAVAFEVAKPVLERAVKRTYAVELEELFIDADVAIATYRWGFRELMQEATGIAWSLYEDDIHQTDPQATYESFVGSMSREDFEKQFGASYRQAGYFTRVFAWFTGAMPEVGPMKDLPYEALPPEARDRFGAAFDHAVRDFRDLVQRSRSGDLELEDRNLDTGRPTGPGEYAPADEAWAELVETLDEEGLDGVPGDVRTAIVHHYRGAPPQSQPHPPAGDGEDRFTPSDDVERAVARLASSAATN
jgi:hypothetical protein